MTIGSAKRIAHRSLSDTSSSILSAEQRKCAIDGTLREASNITSSEAVQGLAVEALTAQQAVLRHGSQHGIWQTPKAWGPTLSNSLLSVDLRERIVRCLPPEFKPQAGGHHGSPQIVGQVGLDGLLDDAVLVITRYLILCRRAPVGMKRAANESLDPSSIAALAYMELPGLAACSIAKRLHRSTMASAAADGSCFAALEAKDIDGLPRRAKKAMRNELVRMTILADKGLWNDAPNSIDARATTSVKGTRTQPDPEPGKDRHRPLPDEYVSEMGVKSAWLIEYLAPNLLTILVDFAGIWRRAASEKVAAGAVSRWCSEYLRNFHWQDGNGEPISGIPFPLRMSLHGKATSDASLPDDDIQSAEARDLCDWPPKGIAHIFGLVRAVQSAHLFVVLLSVGPRRSEVVTMKRTCVTYAKDGERYANGRTYKLTKRHDGEERDWVLPDFAAHAVEQQARMVALFERLAPTSNLKAPDLMPVGSHLWGEISGPSADRARPLGAKGIGHAFVSYAKALGMDINPGGQRLRSHRFRKTLARLAALAITQAPKILQDVFGHKSIEMTLYYILEDKDLRAEIDTVANELRVMRAQEVIEDMVAAEEAREALIEASGSKVADLSAMSFGGYGGLAAVSIHKAIKTQKSQAHRRGEDWGAGGVRELAEILTMKGTTWQLVRPGVVCTKSVGQAGPCSKKKGHPEPARCQTACDHRLEEAWHREDVDATIAEAIGHYVDAGSAGEDLVQAMWAGQVRAHLARFPDLQAKWLLDETVQAITKGEALA